MTPPSTKNTNAATRRRGRPKKTENNFRNEARLSTSRKPPPSPTPVSTNFNQQNTSANNNNLHQSVVAPTATMTTRRSLLTSSQTPNSRKRRRPPPAASVTNVFAEERLPQSCKDFWSWPVSSWYVGDLDEADLRLTDDRPFRGNNHTQKSSPPMPKHYRLQWLEQDASICAGLVKAPSPIPQSIPLMPYARQKDNTGCTRPSLGLAFLDDNESTSNKSTNRNSRSRKSAGKRPTKVNVSPGKDNNLGPSSLSECPAVIRSRTSAKAPRGRPAGSFVEPKNVNFSEKRVTAYMRPADEKSALQISPSTPLGQRMVFSPTTEAIKNAQTSLPQDELPNITKMAPLTISPNTHIESKIDSSTTGTLANSVSDDNQVELRKNIHIQLVSPEQPRLMGTLTYSVPVSQTGLKTELEVEKDETCEDKGKVFEKDGIFLDHFELDFRKADSDFLSSFDDVDKKDDLGHEAKRLDDVLETLNSKTKPLRDVALSAVLNEIKSQDTQKAMLTREKQILARLSQIETEKRAVLNESRPESNKALQTKSRKRTSEAAEKFDPIDCNTQELGLESFLEPLENERYDFVTSNENVVLKEVGTIDENIRHDEASVDNDEEDPELVRPLKRMRRNGETAARNRAFNMVAEIVVDSVSKAILNAKPKGATPKAKGKENVILPKSDREREPKSSFFPTKNLDTTAIICEILYDVITASTEISMSKDSPATTAPFDLAKNITGDEPPEVFESSLPRSFGMKVSNLNGDATNFQNDDQPYSSDRHSAVLGDNDVGDSTFDPYHQETKDDDLIFNEAADSPVSKKKENISVDISVKMSDCFKIELQDAKHLNIPLPEETEPYHQITGSTEVIDLCDDDHKVNEEKTSAVVKKCTKTNVVEKKLKDCEPVTTTQTLNNKTKGSNPLSPCQTDSPLMTTSPCGILPKEDEKANHAVSVEPPTSPILNTTSNGNRGIQDSTLNSSKDNQAHLMYHQGDVGAEAGWKSKDGDVGGSPVSDEENTEPVNEKKLDSKPAEKTT